MTETIAQAEDRSGRGAEVRAWLEAMPFRRTLGARCVTVGRDRAEVRLPFRPEIGFGVDNLFPASAIGALVDICGGAAAATSCEPGTHLVTTDYSTTMLSPAAGEELVARATVPRPGGGTLVAAVEVFADADERPCALGQVTMRVRR